MDFLLSSPWGIGVAGAAGLMAGLALAGSRSDSREHRSSSSGAGGLLWCAFVLVAVVGGAWLFNFPHGGDGGRLDGRPGFGGTIFGDPFGLRRDGGR
jgi:hypothetical protein